MGRHETTPEKIGKFGKFSKVFGTLWLSTVVDNLSIQTDKVAPSCVFGSHVTTMGKFPQHANAARAGAAFASISAPGNPYQEPITHGGPMVPRTGVTVDIHPRDLPMALIGTAGGTLALWANAPAQIAIPTALLIVLDIRIRRWRRHV